MNKDPFPWESRPAIKHSIREMKEAEDRKSDSEVITEALISLAVVAASLVGMAVILWKVGFE